VWRASRRDGDVFWYFQDGRRYQMSADLALAAARRGELKIRTAGDRHVHPAG
jgi:hypothetical protein